MLLEIARNIARVAHAGQVDRAGVCYFSGHIQAVVGGVDSIEAQAVAYLHDVLEDCDVSASELIEAGIPPQVVDGVIAMSKIDGEAYDVYLNRVRSNELARVVKISDLMHNMQLDRLPVVQESDLVRVEKYRGALEFLRQA